MFKAKRQHNLNVNVEIESKHTSTLRMQMGNKWEREGRAVRRENVESDAALIKQLHQGKCNKYK